LQFPWKAAETTGGTQDFPIRCRCASETA